MPKTPAKPRTGLRFERFPIAKITARQLRDLARIDPLFKKYKSLQDFRKTFIYREASYCVAYKNGVPVGYIRYYPPNEHGHGNKLAAKEIFVRESERGKRLAFKMNMHLLGVADRLGIPMLMVEPNQTVARVAKRMEKRAGEHEKGFKFEWNPVSWAYMPDVEIKRKSPKKPKPHRH